MIATRAVHVGTDTHTSILTYDACSRARSPFCAAVNDADISCPIWDLGVLYHTPYTMHAVYHTHGSTVSYTHCIMHNTGLNGPLALVHLSPIGRDMSHFACVSQFGTHAIWDWHRR
eukprot:GHVO01051778.1.p1 GENE.GHVO01051778.1~~GHVO01051778.1.p1  ORF type:complete len:116 (+),score=23.55 GHVO01051778.1:123-470(+)